MSYTQMSFSPDHPERFPEPQVYMVWTEDVKHVPGERIDTTPEFPDDDYDYQRDRDRWAWPVQRSNVGKVRHKGTLAEARKYVASYARARTIMLDNGQVQKTSRPVFWADWKIFQWDGEQWVLEHEGKRGEQRHLHPLWARGLKVETVNRKEQYALAVVQAAARSLAERESA